MAASRATSLRQLNRLAAASNKRSLHMTGPATFPSPLLTSERPAAAQVKRDLEAAQKQADFAIAAESNSNTTVRHFNTSRNLKAVGDTSTIDFAYFPDFDPDVEAAPIARIPLLPSGLYNTQPAYAAEDEVPVMRPEIITAAADSTHISSPRAFSEVHDNSAVDIAAMAERVAAATGMSNGASKDQEPGAIKQVWNGLLEDIFGGQRKAA
ncbi:hypothetical protein NA57DRAFT_74151 [Rhizodiscina lignyota]|uniref:Uncharacterized protein n=1 Tax=Rhizodiscina lignyota TaxID=1504668 RepID=A0A9P4IJU2_9PEZI|nr:hypothetical protein NA57DRAFT_74151 [Rhizodiscina lignyota]